MAQTAVEWIAEKMKKLTPPGYQIEISAMLRKAKQKEKEQIIDSYGIGHNDGCAYMTDGKTEFEDAEQYYNETFGNESL